MADLSGLNPYSNPTQNNPAMKNLYDILNNQDDKSIFSGGSARSQAQKIMEQYDEKMKTDAANTDKSEVDSNAAAQAKTAADVVGAADKFYTSGAELMNNAKKAESGKTVGAVSAAEGGANIAKNIKDFVNTYNKTLDEAKTGSKNGTITNGDAKKVKGMLDTTAAYEKKLAEMGITIGSDNKLSIDTDKLNASTTDQVKELFSGAKSFGAGIMRKADALTGYTASAYDRNVANQYGGGKEKGLAEPESPIDAGAKEEAAAGNAAGGTTTGGTTTGAAETNENAQTAAGSVTKQAGYTPPKGGGYDPIAAAEQRAKEREEAAKIKAAGVE